MRQIGTMSAISGEFVTAVVFRMTGVALEPDGGDLMAFHLEANPFPEVRVENRLFVGFAPAASLPAFDPAF